MLHVLKVNININNMKVPSTKDATDKRATRAMTPVPEGCRQTFQTIDTVGNALDAINLNKTMSDVGATLVKTGAQPETQTRTEPRDTTPTQVVTLSHESLKRPILRRQKHIN